MHWLPCIWPAGRAGAVRHAEKPVLIRWLATAKKQRRFDRDVTPDIDWLLQQGRTLGSRAKLPQKLDYLYAPVQAHYTSRAICSGSLMRLNRPRRQALPISY
ncbi:DUF2913 family protein [Proteus mirabilis]